MDEIKKKREVKAERKKVQDENVKKKEDKKEEGNKKKVGFTQDKQSEEEDY